MASRDLTTRTHIPRHHLLNLDTEPEDGRWEKQGDVALLSRLPHKVH